VMLKACSKSALPAQLQLKQPNATQPLVPTKCQPRQSSHENSLTAFESILEDDCIINESSHTAHYVNTLRSTIATLAAALARMGDALGDSARPVGAAGWLGCGSGGRAGLERVRRLVEAGGCDWGALKAGLKEGILVEQRAYWEGLRSGSKDAPALAWSLTEVGVGWWSVSLDVGSREERVCLV